MASSIHTIYRPLARSRRDKAPSTRNKHKKQSSMSDIEDEPTAEEPVMSEEDLEEDFEPMAGRSPSNSKQGMDSLRMTLAPLPELSSPESLLRSHPTRSGSMGTVKIQRRARLAEKLREVFDVPGIEEVVAGNAKRNMLASNGANRPYQRCLAGY